MGRSGHNFCVTLWAKFPIAQLHAPTMCGWHIGFLIIARSEGTRKMILVLTMSFNSGVEWSDRTQIVQIKDKIVLRYIHSCNNGRSTMVWELFRKAAASLSDHAAY